MGDRIKRVSEVTDPGDGDAANQVKIMVFSGHDANVVGLLAALNMFDPPFWPAYSSALYLELHQISDFHFVKMFFQASVDDDIHELQFPGCMTPCPLVQLFRTYNSTAVWSKSEFDSLCVMDK